VGIVQLHDDEVFHVRWKCWSFDTGGARSSFCSSSSTDDVLGNSLMLHQSHPDCNVFHIYHGKFANLAAEHLIEPIWMPVVLHPSLDFYAQPKRSPIIGFLESNANLPVPLFTIGRGI
jgi:hypothetical protein